MEFTILEARQLSLCMRSPKNFLRITGSRQQVQEGSAVHNLWMDCGKAAEHGVVFSGVMDGLKRCLGDYGLI